MLIDIAFAMGNPGGGNPGDPNSILNMLLLFGPLAVIFYFFLIRPQSKRQKEHQNLIGQLKRGDEVVTSGGIIGRIHSVTDTIVTIEVSPNVRMRVLKAQIAGQYQGESKEEQ